MSGEFRPWLRQPLETRSAGQGQFRPWLRQPLETRSAGQGQFLAAAPLLRHGLRSDAAQAEAVAHRQGEGPLVILGAPGTGRTTTVIEAVAARVERDRVAPDAVLMLAPTRAAATELRARLSARVGRTVREPLARTPHSYAFGLLRRARVLEGEPPPRLLTGAEQDEVLAELLAGHEAGLGRRPRWPVAVTTEIRGLQGFRDELRDLLMIAVERGLTPAELAGLGRRHGRPAWVAGGDLLAEYLDVTALGAPGAYDPAAIVEAASLLLGDDPLLLAAERNRWALVAVDDAQELDTAADRLLRRLVDGGRDLLLAGDPDAATQGFRGALPRQFGEAASRYPRHDGAPARTVVLGTVWRHGSALREVAARVSARIGTAGTAAQRVATAPIGSAPGTVEVHLLGTGSDEAAFVAQDLRRRHLWDAVPWRQMAVVVRSLGQAQLLRRAMAVAGVPFELPGRQTAVGEEQAVLPLRLALRCVLHGLDAAAAVALLSSPLGGADALGVRRLRQQLRLAELEAGGSRSADELIVAELTDPDLLERIEPHAAEPALRLHRVLRVGRAAVEQPAASGETVLWALWDGSGLADAWRRTALGGGPAGARADHDLDALMVLFDQAARYADRLPHAGPAGFLAALEQQGVPSDSLAERAPATEAVTVVTPAGALGREWDVVAVTGVQDGLWPDLRLRGSLLGGQDLADLLDGRLAEQPGGAVPLSAVTQQRRAVLDDELRFFLVAVTRARRHLLVTAVRSEDEVPSPFLDLVDPGDPDGEEVRPLSEVPRTMTLPSLVGQLRVSVADPQESDARREAAAGQLARLAAAGVPGAHPQEWHGLADVSGAGPLRPAGSRVRVSPSKVEAFQRCPLRWLLETAGGGRSSSQAQEIGTIVHAVAHAVPDGDRERMHEELTVRLDELGLGDGWVARRARERAEQMVDKLADYVASAHKQGRELLGTEVEARAQVGRAELRGVVDRLERDRQGRLVVVDLKTGRTPPRAADLPRNPQLGTYQVIAEEGGFEGVPASESGGASLVQLGTPTKRVGVMPQGPLSADADPQWAHAMVEQVAEGMAGEQFPATSNGMCRFCPVRRSCPLQSEGRQVGS